MKKRLFITLLTLIGFGLSGWAQDAFYIYQNDGHFDGFFYDQVQKITYSKLDTLGIEHDDYVSQEIITADSTYRIMLSAIDSVSFVQPEIKFNPHLRDMRKESMLAYLTAHDEDAMILTFNSTMPETLKPQVGDVLVDFCPDDIDKAFGGKVTAISEDGGWKVQLEPLTSLKDIFEQFTTVEEYSRDSQGAILSRRVAGLPELTINKFPKVKAPRKRDHQFEFDFFNFSFNTHVPLFTDPSEDWNISIDPALTVATHVKAVWNFTGQTYLGVTTTLDVAAKLGFTVDYKFKDIFPANLDELGYLPIPAAAPIFVVNLAPDIFFRGDCHANFNATLPELRGKFWIKVEVIEDWMRPHVHFKSVKPRDAEEQKAEDESNRWSGAVEFNGFVQCGVKEGFTFKSSKLISWFADGKIAATAYIGPKLSGALNLSFSNAIQDQLSVYNVAKDSKLTLNPLAVDYECKATMKTLFGRPQEVTLADGSLDLIPGINTIEAYAFPEFDFDMERGVDEEGNTTVKADIRPSRNLIWPIDYGAGIFDEAGDMVDYCLSNEIGVKKYGIFEFNYPKKERFEHTFTVKKPGKYTMRPIFKIGWNDVVASPAKEFTVYQLELAQESVSFYSKGGTTTVEVNTNADKLSLTSSSSWISATYDSQTKTLSVSAAANGSKSSREGVVTLKIEEDGISITKTLTVKQAGKGGQQGDSDSPYNGVYLYYNLNYIGNSPHSYMQYVPLLAANKVMPAACSMNDSIITATGEDKWVGTSWRSGYWADGSEIRDTLWYVSSWSFNLTIDMGGNVIKRGVITKQLSSVQQHLKEKVTRRRETTTYVFQNLPLSTTTFPVPYEDNTQWQPQRQIGSCFGYDSNSGVPLKNFLTAVTYVDEDNDTETTTTKGLDDINTSDWTFQVILVPEDDYVKPFH